MVKYFMLIGHCEIVMSLEKHQNITTTISKLERKNSEKEIMYLISEWYIWVQPLRHITCKIFVKVFSKIVKINFPAKKTSYRVTSVLHCSRNVCLTF